MLAAVTSLDAVKEFFKRFPTANMTVEHIESDRYSMARYGYPTDMVVSQYSFWHDYSTIPSHSSRTVALKVVIDENKMVRGLTLECDGAFTSWEETALDNIRTYCPSSP